jgi:4-amino-4-deoxy-L-arabinose transferase-like glycosyltransferase
MKTTLIRYLPFIFALTFFLQGSWGNLAKSLTWDEPVFIASGYSYLTRNDFRMNAEAPPLLQQLQALPLLNLQLQQIDTTHAIWQDAAHIVNGQYFIQANAQHLSTISQRARFPTLIIGTLLVLAIFFWSQQLYGTTPALLASAIAACSPNLLAHAKLATTDLGCAAFIFFATITFWYAIQHPHWKRWLLCGITTGLALLTKYTALLLGPTYILLGLGCVWQKQLSLRDLIKGGLIITFTSYLIIGIGYHFTFTPFLYLNGLQKIYANANVGYQFYLFGNVSENPFWYYYIVAFLIKTPVATLLLLGIATAIFISNISAHKTSIFPLLPALLILVISCFDKSNLGYRRILPALPFLLLFCSQALAAVPSTFLKKLVALLFCFTLLESLSIYPHHLSFFNQAVGGPKQGPYLLDDSNIDWGQDLPGLAKWQQKHPQAKPMKQMYFGSLPPKLYGIDAEQLPLNTNQIRQPEPHYYAMSTHQLTWFRKIKKQYNLDIDWLTKYKPIDRIGYSIYIYKFPESSAK